MHVRLLLQDIALRWDGRQCHVVFMPEARRPSNRYLSELVMTERRVQMDVEKAPSWCELGDSRI